MLISSEVLRERMIGVWLSLEARAQTTEEPMVPEPPATATRIVDRLIYLVLESRIGMNGWIWQCLSGIVCIHVGLVLLVLYHLDITVPHTSRHKPSWIAILLYC